MTTLPAVVRVVDLPTGTTITGVELIEAVQTSNGVGLSIQVSLATIMSSIGGLPTGGATGQLLSKTSGSNYSTSWSSINSLVTVNGTTLATSGSATAILVNVASGGIGSTQLGTFAVQSLNVATNAIGSTQLGTFAVQSSNVATNAIGNVQLRQGGPLSLIGVAGNATANVADILASGANQVLAVNAGGTGLLFTTIPVAIPNNSIGTLQLATNIGVTGTFSAGGTASFSGGVVSTGTLNVVGTTLITGTFGVVGTTNFTTDAFGIVGTTLITGTFGQVGTSLMTGLFGITGTTNITGFLTVVGSSIFTGGTFGVNATANFTGAFGLVGAANITGFLTNVGSAIFTGGTFGVNATAAFTGVFGQVGTSLMTGRFGVSGTANFTGAFNVVGTTLFTSGTFGVVGTTLFTGAFGVVGTTNFTGIFSVVGTTLFTSGTFGIVGTTLVTGVFGVVGTSNLTGAVAIVGTTNITGALVLNNSTSGILVASSTGLVSSQGGMVLLNTLSPNGVASATDTTSFTSTYRSYMFVFDNICPATNTNQLQVQFATSGSNFIAANYVCYNAIVAINNWYSTSSIFLSGSGVSSGTVNGVTGNMILYAPSSSNMKKSVTGQAHYMIAGAITTANVAVSVFAGNYDGTTSPVTGISFSFTSGNIATGTIKIYGIT